MKIDVINNGYIELVEHWGSDERIIEAARMSTDKGFQGWGPKCSKCNLGPDIHPNAHCDELSGSKAFVPGDERLLRYLYEHKHMTPFEMAGATIEVQAPIFVFREWHRHRTQSYNELSARYTELPDLCYLPSEERILMGKQSTTNRQSSEAATFTQSQVQSVRELIDSQNRDARHTYEELLAVGVAREIARIVLPVGQISRMRASANLRNWLAFLTLRMNPAAQWEICQYANALGVILSGVFPHTWQLFAESVTRDGSEHA